MQYIRPEIALEHLSKLFGRTRQAYYQWQKRLEKTYNHSEQIVEMVKQIRRQMPRIGSKKLYSMLKEDLRIKGIKVGRDKFIEILRDNNLLIKTKRNRKRTTNSNHWLRKYPNKIKSINIHQPNQAWVCDITYIKTKNGFSYLSLISDIYSRKIVGYTLSTSLDNQGSINALTMALQAEANTEDLVHHSDRGIQYCSKDYIKILNKNKMQISMTENGDPYENAIAERINGILKAEFFISNGEQNHDTAKKNVAEAIKTYNNVRPHMSLEMHTPEEVHRKKLQVKRLWKSYQTTRA